MINGGDAPAIQFSEKFSERPLPDQIDYLKKLASSQNQALDQMQKERNDLAAKLALTQTQLKNADDALAIQKEVVKNLITKSNADDQGTAARIQELEARVKAQDSVIEDGHLG